MQKSESSQDKPVNCGDRWLGIVLLLLAMAAIGFSRSIEAIGLGDNHDPGPRFFPISMAAFLAVGGVWEILLYFFSGRTNILTTSPGNENESSDGWMRLFDSHKTAGLLMASFALYIIVLPYLGFALATWAASAVMMRILGNSFIWALIVSLLLVVVIHVTFAYLLKVPLPEGIFQLPV